MVLLVFLLLQGLAGDVSLGGLFLFALHRTLESVHRASITRHASRCAAYRDYRARFSARDT